MAGLFGNSQKKIIRKTFPVHFLKNLEIKNKYTNKISMFYNLLSNRKIKKKKNFFNTNITDTQEKLIGAFTGYKKRIRLRGIGYKFLLNNNNIILRIGFTHTFNIILSSLLYYRLNKKHTKLALKFNNFNKLTLFLSAFQNVQRPNIYSGKGIRYNLKKFRVKEVKKKKF